MNKTLNSFIIFLFMLTGFQICEASSSIKLSISAGRGSRDIAVGDLFYITYEVSDIDKAPEKPTDVGGAKVLYFERTGQSSRFSSINGKVTQSSSVTYTATLRAQTEGSYSFGPVKIGNVQSNVVRYNILAQGAGSPTPGGGSQSSVPDARDNDGKPKFIGKGDGNLFMRAEVSSTSAYPQEALVYTVKLYTTYDAIKFIGATASPKFDGFVVEESKDISTSLQYENYNGKNYATAVIARYIIFPQMEGELKVTGNTYTVSVDEREYYHDPFWGNMSVAKPLQLNVTPNDLVVNVKPLPKPVPADFSGGVGQFKLTSSLPSQSLMSNTAASIVYTVSGNGNLKYVTLPDLQKLYPPQLEVYSPSTEVDVNVGRSNVSGKVVFDYSFMPLEPGQYNIPAVKLVYFNPATGKYETSSAPGYSVNVGQGEASAKSLTKNINSFNKELMKVKESGLTNAQVPIIRTFGFWVFFYIIPTFLFIAVIIYYRRYLKLNEDIVAVKSRKASKIARRRLKNAEICMKKGETDKFYDVLLASIWGYIGDKLKMPVSELNRNNIREVFAQKGLSEEISDKVIQLVDDCEFYKYSSAGAAKDMKEVYDSAVVVIDTLEKKLG